MKPSWQPTPEQECLLEACLESGDRAEKALQVWLGSLDLQRIDGATYRLLPLLAARGLPDGVDPEVRALIRGVYRRTWYHNTLLLGEAGKLAALLGAAGIPTMLIKGSALTVQHYRDIGTRPMGDLDLAVPTESARQALELLFAQGWTQNAIYRSRSLELFAEPLFCFQHALGIRNANGIEIDLHWHVFAQNLDPDSDAETWRTASRITHRGSSFLVPTTHEHLLLVLTHAVRWGPTRPIRWVADAITLIRTAPDLDWDGFVAVAVRRGHVGTAHELLAYLASRFRVEVPSRVLASLAQHSATVGRQIYHPNNRTPTFFSGWAELRRLHRQYRILRDRSPERCPKGFVRFLASALGEEHPTQVPGYLMGVALRRLRRGLGVPAPAPVRSK